MIIIFMSRYNTLTWILSWRSKEKKIKYCLINVLLFQNLSFENQHETFSSTRYSTFMTIIFFTRGEIYFPPDCIISKLSIFYLDRNSWWKCWIIVCITLHPVSVVVYSSLEFSEVYQMNSELASWHF